MCYQNLSEVNKMDESKGFPYQMTREWCQLASTISTETDEEEIVKVCQNKTSLKA